MNEIEEQFLAPYKKVKAVQETYESNSCLDFYRSCYEKRFKVKPLQDIAYHTVMRDIIKKAGSAEHAKELIVEFFAMDSEEFEKKGYSPECLKYNLDAVNVRIGVKSGSKGPNRRVLLFPKAYCDECTKYGEIEVQPNQVCDWTLVCNECKAAGKKPRRYIEKTPSEDGAIK